MAEEASPAISDGQIPAVTCSLRAPTYFATVGKPISPIGIQTLENSDDKGKTITLPRQFGKAYFITVLFFCGIIVIAGLLRGHLLETTGTTIAIGLLGLVVFFALLSGEVCVFQSKPRLMRIERWVIDRRISEKTVDIEAVNWIRSRWTIQGITLELGFEESWDTIEVQTTYMYLQQFGFGRGQQESRVNEIRASIAQLLDIKDAGWEKFPTQRKLP